MVNAYGKNVSYSILLNKREGGEKEDREDR